MNNPKALKSQSVQILIIGAIVCTAMSIVLMLVGYWLDFDGILTVIQIVVGTIAGGFAVLIGGRKGRDMLQARNGHYFDEGEQRLKDVNSNYNNENPMP